MQIICATPQAAAQVLETLLNMGVHTTHDFTIQPLLSTKPPLIFTMITGLADKQLVKIRAVSDTTISE